MFHIHVYQKEVKKVRNLWHLDRDWSKLYLKEWDWFKGSHMTKGSLASELNRMFKLLKHSNAIVVKLML